MHVVYLNPLSYSRSHRMRGDFELKRDHPALLRALMARLVPGGVVFFATHARGFELAPQLKRELTIADLSARILPRDYRRSPFHAYRITA